ncbi:MAG: anthranilate synthase component I family protein [Candidatus Hadarchaeales archaeon]
MEIKLTRLTYRGDAVDLFFSKKNSALSFLLESAERGRFGRYSIMGWDPILHFIGFGGKEDPLQEMLKELQSLELPQSGVPYQFGVFGYIGYDYVRFLHKLPQLATDDLHHPILEFLLPRELVIIDHETGEAVRCRYESEERREIVIGEGEDRPSPPSDITVQKEEFIRKVERVKEYIASGDIIQAVISRRIPLRSPSLQDFYLRLRSINPSPYMYLLDFGNRKVVGSSPEMLVRVDGREIMTRPIAGTRRRGRDEEEDRRIELGLLRDEKERAEHVMLVDLARNDLGKVCEFGSVSVPEFMIVEKFSHVQHLVSTVRGRLRPGIGTAEVVRATFPAGTVTGAPKFRAMEIIEEMEPTRRGIYAGAVGFIGPSSLNLAITIRTLVMEREWSHVQVGAGIVADSTPWKEWLETENKAAALLEAAGVRG